jgi:predicted nucleic acid-binding protein
LVTVRQSLGQHRLIGLDTSIFIYHLEVQPRYHPLTKELFEGIEQGHWLAVTSVITLLELTVGPWQEERADLALAYETLLDEFPNLAMPDMTRAIARQAAQLRARHRLRAADSLQVATALAHQATALVTNDRGLSRLSGELEIVLLDDLSS